MRLEARARHEAGRCQASGWAETEPTEASGLQIAICSQESLMQAYLAFLKGEVDGAGLG